MTNVLEKVRKQLIKRGRVLFGENDYSLPERLQIASARHPNIPANRFMRSRLVNGDHFHVSNMDIYFRPDYPIDNEDQLISGICQVLNESYTWPTRDEVVYPRSGDVVFDLGGNIGTVALEFAQTVGAAGHVYVFEPVMASTIEKNAQANGIDNVTVLEAAVSDEKGEIDIEMSDFCLDSSICKRDYTSESEYYTQTKKVPMMTLDEFVDERGLERVDFIKMDIEGAEELALNGSVKLIERFKPKWSISSYHIDFENEKQHPKLVRFLKKMGYDIKEDGQTHIFAW